MQLPYANLQMAHMNPGAEKPLILPIHVICNTSDEEIYNNIRVNSRNHGNWIKAEKAHDGIAILCGSGPSLFDTLEDVRQKQALGGKVFAMNGAAKFLNDHGIYPDYQVIIDAREQTAELVGPAAQHLFASQVSPECFKRADARLWHLQVENIDDLLPDYEDDYCLIGGAASVGNTATCLVYAMGYRNLQIYGYDSSHREGKGHAFHQKMNDGDPCCVVSFNGKEYTASLTMKLQAEKFQETARSLKSLGCHIEVHGSGLLPDMFNAKELPEQEKYRLMWACPEYREYAPGEVCAEKFLEVAKPDSTVIDFGCGTGRGALKIHRSGVPVLLVDFAMNSRDQAAMELPFVQWDLSEPMPFSATYGYCTDVMEHIPPDQVDGVIRNILGSARKVFFQISLIDDVCGSLIGQPLHLSIHPYSWWKERFENLGYEVMWSEDQGATALYYVTEKT